MRQRREVQELLSSKSALARSSKQDLRLAQSSNPTLPERLGMQLQMVQPPHRTTEHISARLHRRFPCTRIDVETCHDRRKRGVNVASLVIANRTTGPIDDLQVLFERVRDVRRPTPLI